MSIVATSSTNVYKYIYEVRLTQCKTQTEYKHKLYRNKFVTAINTYNVRPRHELIFNNT